MRREGRHSKIEIEMTVQNQVMLAHFTLDACRRITRLVLGIFSANLSRDSPKLAELDAKMGEL